MAWGGGMGGGFGTSATQQSAAAGLPFAGVPAELRERADRIESREPDHPAPTARFTHSGFDRHPFTLRRFLRPRALGLAGAGVLVIVETIASQMGPLLTQRAIDDGVANGAMDTLVVLALLYAASVVASIVLGAARVAWTGRLGESLLYDLRLRVFAHLQRLSLDYYTDEKAGRVLTRMTSDIDALTQLFQEGLVNLAVQ
ncbi:MAG TPA: ABC transporter transmembrane domain-containing protein, partial [Acidimicrobiales bacterium]